MAFCMAELHLWSTKNSLKVKGRTYHHVQSPTLNNSLSGPFCHHSLCFHTFSPPYLYLLSQSNSQSTPILFSLSLCSLQIVILRMSVYCIIHDILYIDLTPLTQYLSILLTCNWSAWPVQHLCFPDTTHTCWVTLTKVQPCLSLDKKQTTFLAYSMILPQQFHVCQWGSHACKNQV